MRRLLGLTATFVSRATPSLAQVPAGDLPLTDVPDAVELDAMSRIEDALIFGFVQSVFDALDFGLATVGQGETAIETVEQSQTRFFYLVRADRAPLEGI